MMRAPSGSGAGRLAGAVIFAVPLGLVLLAPLLFPGDPRTPSGVPFLPPSWAHPLGTDDLGRDMLAALAHGGRASLWSGGLVALGAALLGVLAGVMANWPVTRATGLVAGLVPRLSTGICHGWPELAANGLEFG